ncbi:MAG: hypothetical protein AAGG02_08680 [Cyanobacteria bacterium P01_H01_bin.15]
MQSIEAAEEFAPRPFANLVAHFRKWDNQAQIPQLLTPSLADYGRSLARVAIA